MGRVKGSGEGAPSHLPWGLLFLLSPIFHCYKIKDGGYNTNNVSPTQNTPALQARVDLVLIQPKFLLYYVNHVFFMQTGIFLSIISIRKGKRFVSKQGQPQPHIHSKAGTLFKLQFPVSTLKALSRFSCFYKPPELSLSLGSLLPFELICCLHLWGDHSFSLGNTLTNLMSFSRLTDGFQSTGNAHIIR